MQTDETNIVLKYDNLMVSDRGMFELHGKKVVIFAPAADIVRVTVKFGRSDHRPVFSMTVGIILSLVGLFGLAELLILGARGFRYKLAMLALGIIGGSMIFDTLKKRFFLEVEKKQGGCRLIFSKQAALKDIQAFCGQTREHYKYPVGEDL